MKTTELFLNDIFAFLLFDIILTFLLQKMKSNTNFIQIVLLCVLIFTSYQCSTGQYLNLITNKCNNCSSNCFNCTNSIFCTVCNSIGYYLNPTTKICNKCESSCFKCNNSKNCSSCLSNYYLNSTSLLCIKCNSTCKTCNTTTSCSTCERGYFINSKTNYCSPCDSSCLTCNTAITCLTCNSSDFLNDTTKLCNKCDISCSKCTNRSACISCAVAYYMVISSQLCVPCVPSCASCIQQHCFSCNPGYSFDPFGNCTLTIASSSSLNPNIIAAITVSVICGVMLIVILILLYLHLKKIKYLQSQVVPPHQPIIKSDFITVQVNHQLVFRQIQSTICSICLESGCDLVTNCHHFFHSSCLKEWIMKNEGCPTCRSVNIKMVKIILCLKCRVCDTLDIFDPNFSSSLQLVKKQQDKCTKLTVCTKDH